MEKQYGVTNQNVIANEFDFHIEEFRILGYTVIENFFSENELQLLRNELDRVYNIQEEIFTKEKLSSINEEYLARALLYYSEEYLKLASNPKMMKYVEKILGKYFILHLQNGIINMPKEEHHQSSWHRDLPYQNWVSSESLGCNMFCCLDTFNEETGAT
jgi:ectoine hydroxylase-related dioxygenase (phytanoyl-CoA dioxygenase family)